MIHVNRCRCGGANVELWSAKNRAWMPHAGMYHVGVSCHNCGRMIHDHYADKREGERDIIAKWNGQGRLGL